MVNSHNLRRRHRCQSSSDAGIGRTWSLGLLQNLIYKECIKTDLQCIRFDHNNIRTVGVPMIKVTWLVVIKDTYGCRLCFGH